MTTTKPLNWAFPVTGACVGGVVAGAGLLVSHLAFYFAAPILILALRLLDAAGIRLALPFDASIILLAVLSPVLFASYGAAVAAPHRSRTRKRIAIAIVAANVVALIMLAL
jgi:hypothetical protein